MWTTCLRLLPESGTAETRTANLSVASPTSWPLHHQETSLAGTALTDTVVVWLDINTTVVLWPFFRDHPCELVLEENFWTLFCKGWLTEADTLTIRLGATPSGLTSAHLHHPPYFLQAGCPSCRPTNSMKALKATSAFGLGRRCWSFPHRCYLHRLRTLPEVEQVEEENQGEPADPGSSGKQPR